MASSAPELVVRQLAACCQGSESCGAQRNEVAVDESAASAGRLQRLSGSERSCCQVAVDMAIRSEVASSSSSTVESELQTAGPAGRRGWA